MQLTGRAQSVAIFHTGNGAAQVLAVERATLPLRKQIIAMVRNRIAPEEMNSLVLLVLEDRMTAHLRPLSRRLIKDIQRGRADQTRTQDHGEPQEGRRS